MRNQPWILLVDDDADVQGMMAELFAREGYSVELASNGAEAIELLEGTDVPCALVVDLVMPGVVGNELLEYVRSEPRLGAIAIAIVSGRPDLAPAGYRVFTKPFAREALLEFVTGRCPT